MPPGRAIKLPLLFKQPNFYAFQSPVIQYAAIPLRGIRTAAKASRLAYKKTARPSRISQSRPSAMEREPKEEEESDHSGINFYEQDASLPNAKRRRISDPDDPLNALTRSYDKEIAELKEEIRALDIPVEATDEDGMVEGLTEEQRARVQRAFEKSLQDRDGESGPDPFDVMPHAIGFPKDLPAAGKIFLNKLNDALDNASLDTSDAGSARELWKYYERGKIYVPNLLRLLPDAAWQLIWLSQSEESIHNPNRTSHLRILTDDMAKVGRILDENQRSARIEGLFRDGEHVKALQMWEDGLKAGWGSDQKFVIMGVRMYAERGELKRAKEIAEALFVLHKSSDPRILMELIQACIQAGDGANLNRAWKWYGHLRSKLKGDITMEDFDAISLDFLDAGQTEYGFAVFRDMMLFGEEIKDATFWQQALGKVTSLMKQTNNPEQVSGIALRSLDFLPRRWQNKFFYASWIKKLIGMGKLDGASQVVDLMYERGVAPDAKHMNGLITAWLRQPRRVVQRQGEYMAWAMIQKRLDFVHERAKESERSFLPLAQVSHELVSREEAEDPARRKLGKIEVPRIDQSRPAPAATIETFCVLAQHYLRKGVFSNMDHLRNLVHAAEIPMNSYFMNHILNAELQWRHYRAVYNRFEVWSRHITPDADTFGLLWSCMESHINPVVNTKGRGGFPAPRKLLTYMVEWFEGLNGRARQEALEDMSQELYDRILRVFWVDRDLPGSLIAMHVLRRTFNLAPNKGTMRIMLVHIAALSIQNPKLHSFNRFTAGKALDDNVERTTRVLSAITDIRQEEYEQKGYTMESLDDESLREEQHRIALQLLYTVIQQVYTDSDGPKNADQESPIITDTARSMGVKDLDLEKELQLVV